MADTDRNNVVRRARDTLALYFLRGSAPAPGAVAFDLIALDPQGSSTGAGVTVCTDCVSRVAAEAFARMYGMTPPADPEPGTWKALIEVGAASVYELAPQSELPYDTFCGECERLLTGNHINSCNGRWYVAGPREGRVCFCDELVRLSAVRRGDRSRLQDQQGNLYREEIAIIPAGCDSCGGPIRVGEVSFVSLATAGPLCCRCSMAY
jgi:hypothetical protein